MYKTAAIATLAASASAATFHDVTDHSAIPGQYIVTLKKNHDGHMLRNHVEKISAVLGDEIATRHVYENFANHGYAAYAAKLSPKALSFLIAHDAVEDIEQDRVVSINDCKTEKNADWGIARTNQRGAFDNKATHEYHYTTGKSGKGVDAYVIDTGIYCENNEFTQKQVGSCSWGIDMVDGSEVDGNGHGTHCAGTIAGQTYGVAKEADLIAVRVLNSRGSGSSSDVLGGMDWVAGNAQKTGKPSTANMSLGGGYSRNENRAAEAIVSAGVVLNVAAGNEDQNACDTSPASAKSAITVGATDNTDARAYYSNFGECLDVFGPGSDITSSWIGAPDATNTISGTSMATPHVCGVTAKFLSEDPSATPAQITARIVGEASVDVLTGVDGGLFSSAADKSPNLLVYGNCA